MTLKPVKREDFKLDGDTVTHTPSGKWYSAYPGMSDISNQNVVDVGDYREYEIRRMAQQLLGERLKKK